MDCLDLDWRIHRGKEGTYCLTSQRCHHMKMRKLTDRELDLLVNGANSLASSWKLKALIEEIRKDPGVIAAGKEHGRDNISH